MSLMKQSGSSAKKIGVVEEAEAMRIAIEEASVLKAKKEEVIRGPRHSPGPPLVFEHLKS